MGGRLPLTRVRSCLSLVLIWISIFYGWIGKSLALILLNVWVVDIVVCVLMIDLLRVPISLALLVVGRIDLGLV